MIYYNTTGLKQLESKLKKAIKVKKGEKLIVKVDPDYISVEFEYLNCKEEDVGTIEYSFDCEFDIETVHYCCGLYEIGDIQINDDSGNIIPKELKIEFIKIKLLNEFNNEVKGKACNLFQFTIPVKSSKGKKIDKYSIFEQGAIAAGFECVAQFKNSNSGNFLKHYIKYK